MWSGIINIRTWAWCTNSFILKISKQCPILSLIIVSMLLVFLNNLHSNLMPQFLSSFPGVIDDDKDLLINVLTLWSRRISSSFAFEFLQDFIANIGYCATEISTSPQQLRLWYDFYEQILFFLWPWAKIIRLVCCEG